MDLHRRDRGRGLVRLREDLESHDAYHLHSGKNVSAGHHNPANCDCIYHAHVCHLPRLSGVRHHVLCLPRTGHGRCGDRGPHDGRHDRHVLKNDTYRHGNLRGL